MTRENHTAANSDARKREAERLAEVPTIEAVLAAHEARWTTHGYDRPYGVMHCVSPDCDWRLRQTALMSNDDCYEAYRAHLADAIRQAGAR